MFKYQWVQFCRKTSLHGWNFTVLHKTTKYERFIWVIICLMALMGALFLVLTAWFEFQLNPTITVTESTQYPIYKFEFPAITICSLNKISKELAYKMANKLEMPNGITVKSLATNLSLLFQLVNNDNQNVPKEIYEELQKILDLNKRTSEEVYKLISPSCDTLLKECSWKGKYVRCNSIFEKIKTSIGYCCSFNYFALKNYAVSGSFQNKSPKKPRRVSSCGYQSGLEVLVNNEPNDYFATDIPSTGLRVLIHYSYDFPDWSVQTILCEINTNNFIGINPTIITASKDIKKIPISQRKCLFSDERDLINFVKYNFHNCMVECRMILNMKHCNCIPFYLHNEKDLLYNDSYISDFNIKNRGKCNCLPNCEGAFYVPKASNGILDATYSTDQFSIHSESALDNHTVVRVFFDDLIGTRLRTDSVFTWHKLMGYYGGIMGLFTGFSFISLIEIIYFTTIRLPIDLINKKKKKTDFNHGKKTVIKFVMHRKSPK